MRRIHWFSIILFLFHAGGCASDVSLNEQQNVVAKQRSTESGVETEIVEQQPTQTRVHQHSADHSRLPINQSERQSSGLLEPNEENSAKSRSDAEQFFEVKKDSRVNNKTTPTHSPKPSDGFQHKERDSGRRALPSDSLLTRGETFEQGRLLPEAKVSEDGAGELSKMASQEKVNVPFVADLLEEEKLYEKAAANLSEEKSNANFRNDLKLTMNSESMSPSSGTKYASVSPELKANEADSLENRTGRDPSQFNMSEDISHQSSPEPETSGTLLDKGKAYLSGGDHEMAFAEFDRLVGLSNDALSYYYRGYTSIKLHRYKEAVSDLSQAIRVES